MTEYDPESRKVDNDGMPPTCGAVVHAVYASSCPQLIDGVFGSRTAGLQTHQRDAASLPLRLDRREIRAGGEKVHREIERDVDAVRLEQGR